MSRRVLVVDDDSTVSEVVVDYLRRAGFDAESTTDGEQALTVAAVRPPDLAVLDLMLPGMSGMEVCQRLRATRPVPVIMLTALGDESDRVAGLEHGADDYVTKPFSARELVLRVESVLRRASAPPAASSTDVGRLRAGAIEVDVEARRALRSGRELMLTAREFDLLAFLMAHPDRPFSREELLERVWGWTFGDRSTVTVHIRRLREKVEVDPGQPALLTTVWGIGYRLAADE